MNNSIISNKTNAPLKINMEIVFDHANNCGSLVINGNPVKIDSGTIRTGEYGEELRIWLSDQHCIDTEDIEIRIPYHLIEQSGLTNVYEKQKEIMCFPIWYQYLYGLDFDEKVDWRKLNIFHIYGSDETQQNIELGQVNQFPQEEEDQIEDWCLLHMGEYLSEKEFAINRRINEIDDEMKISADPDSPLFNYKHKIEVLEKCKKHLDDIGEKYIRPYVCSLSQKSEEE
jgi:hypothetical protein